MSTVRKRVAEILEANRPGDPVGTVVDSALIALIVANVLAAILVTLPSIRAEWRSVLLGFEIFSIGVFTIEYLLRLWSCVDKERYAGLSPARARLKWMTSPLGLIDLLAILPFYLLFLFPTDSHTALLLRVFRGMRLLRIFKLTRYSPAISIFRSVLKQESGTLTVVAFVLTVAVVLAAWGIFILEHEAQPEEFGSIPHALWWSVVSLTTVGYGDVVPLTAGGKIFASIIALLGVGMAALPAGILASGFTSEIRRRESAYSRALHMAMADGEVSTHEYQQLEEIRVELGLSKEEAHGLFLDARRAAQVLERCPHCGKHLHT